MALPEEFNDVEHLQSVCRLVVNKMVREDFNDIGGDDWDKEISSARGSLRVACTHEDQDSLNMTVARLLTYYMVQGKASRLMPPMYAIPTEEYQESVAFKPQILLFFAQDSAAVPEGRNPVLARLHIRVSNESNLSITPTDATNLARQIRDEFVIGGNGYAWDKGKNLCTYRDRDLGYNLKLYAISDEVAETVIKKILAIRNHTFDSDNFTPSMPRRKSENNPTGTTLVYGKQVKKPRWRPTAKVRFRYASLHIHGLTQDVMLVDTTGKHRDALIRV